MGDIKEEAKKGCYQKSVTNLKLEKQKMFAKTTGNKK